MERPLGLGAGPSLWLFCPTSISNFHPIGKKATQKCQLSPNAQTSQIQARILSSPSACSLHCVQDRWSRVLAGYRFMFPPKLTCATFAGLCTWHLRPANHPPTTRKTQDKTDSAATSSGSWHIDLTVGLGGPARTESCWLSESLMQHHQSYRTAPVSIRYAAKQVYDRTPACASRAS